MSPAKLLITQFLPSRNKLFLSNFNDFIELSVFRCIHWSHANDGCLSVCLSVCRWTACTVEAWCMDCAGNCSHQPPQKVSWACVLQQSNFMNICSMPQGHMRLLNYSCQRVNLIQKRKGKGNKVPASQRAEWEPPQTVDTGMREAIAFGYWWLKTWRNILRPQRMSKLSASRSIMKFCLKNFLLPALK